MACGKESKPKENKTFRESLRTIQSMCNFTHFLYLSTTFLSQTFHLLHQFGREFACIVGVVDANDGTDLADRTS